MEIKETKYSASHISGTPITNWQLGRIRPTPTHVPDGWELLQLTSVARLESGHTPSKRKPEYWHGAIPWISLHDSAALDVLEITNTAQTVSALGLANSSARLLPKGTVIFSRTATVGKATVMGRGMATSQDFANYVCGERVHNYFLVHLFRHLGPEWNRLMAGSTHNSIYMPVFRELQVLLPPLPEQRAIATALSDVDALLAKLNQLIAKKRDIKQANMQQLLTGQTRLPGFSGEWEEKSLGAIGDITSAGVDKKTRKGEIPVRLVNYLDVYRKDFLFSSDLSHTVTASHPQMIRCEVKRGDIFFTPSSETRDDVAHSAVAMEDIPDAAYSYHVIRLRIRDNWDIVFRAYAFKTKAFYDQAQIFCDGNGTRYVISQGKFRSMTILVPPIEEQSAISTVLSDMDAEIAALEARRDKTHALKQGMMQELLTGRIRLV